MISLTVLYGRSAKQLCQKCRTAQTRRIPHHNYRAALIVSRLKTTLRLGFWPYMSTPIR